MLSLVEKVELKAPLAMGRSASLRDLRLSGTVTCPLAGRPEVGRPVETGMILLTMMILVLRVRHPPLVEEVEAVVGVEVTGTGTTPTVLEYPRVDVERRVVSSTRLRLQKSDLKS